MSTALRYLLDVNDAPNELAYIDQPPSATIVVDSEVSAVLTFPMLSGYSYQVEATDYLQTTDPWDTVSVERGNRLWQTVTVSETIDTMDTERFYRIRPLSN